MSADAVAFLDQIRTFFQGADGETGPQGPAGGYFPHQSAGWANIKAAREALRLRLSKLPRADGHREPGPAFAATGGPGSHSYSDVTAMMGRELFYATFNRSTPYIRKADGSFYAVSSAAIDGVVEAGISGSMLLPASGRVFQVPYSYGKALAFNRATEQQEIVKADLPGVFKWNLGSVSPEGVVYGTPHMSKTIFAFDENAPSGAQWWQSEPIAICDFAYAGRPTHFPDGWTFFPPYNETRALLINRVTRQVVLGPSGVFPGGEAFVSSRLLDENNVLVYPHKNGRPAIWNKLSGQLLHFPQMSGIPVGTGNAAVDVANFNGGIPLPTNRDILVPYRSDKAFEVDATNMTSRALPGSYGGEGAMKNGCVTDEGHGAMAPFNATGPAFAMTGQGVRLDPEFLLSAY